MIEVARCDLIILFVTPVVVSCCGSSGSASTSPAQPLTPSNRYRPRAGQSASESPDFLSSPTTTEQGRLTRSAGGSAARARPAESRRLWQRRIRVMVGAVQTVLTSSVSSHAAHCLNTDNSLLTDSCPLRSCLAPSSTNIPPPPPPPTSNTSTTHQHLQHLRYRIE